MISQLSINSNKTDCPSCQNASRPVLDCTTGDLICTSCGLVLQAQCLDESQEWRSFASDGVTTGERVVERQRADMRTRGDDLLGESDLVLGTSISGCSAMAMRLQKAQFALSNQPRNTGRSNQRLKDCIGKVRDLGVRLGLDEIIMRRGAELLNALWKKNNLPKQCVISFFLAIIYIACKEEEAGRTYKELATTSTGGRRKASVRTISDHATRLTKLLAEELSSTQLEIKNEELLPRFVSRLGLIPKDVCETAGYFANEMIRHDYAPKAGQAAVVGASIFTVAWLLNTEPKPTFAQVAASTKAAEVEIRGAYYLLRPNISKFLAGRPNFVCRLPGGLAALPKVNSRKKLCELERPPCKSARF